ncbi:MAG: hypothetical protein ACOVNY_10205 [Chitinophagaceae bacterium]
MKKITILFIAVFFAALSFAQDAWKTIQVMEKVTAQMPVTPTTENRGGQNMQVCKSADSSVLMLMSIDFTPFGLDENMLATLVPTQEFKDQFKGGMVGKMANSTILDESYSMLQDKYHVYNYTIEMAKDGKKIKMYLMTIFYKSYSVALYYTEGDKANKAEKDKFFSSVKIAD